MEAPLVIFHHVYFYPPCGGPEPPTIALLWVRLMHACVLRTMLRAPEPGVLYSLFSPVMRDGTTRFFAFLPPAPAGTHDFCSFLVLPTREGGALPSTFDTVHCYYARSPTKHAATTKAVSRHIPAQLWPQHVRNPGCARVQPPSLGAFLVTFC